MRQQQWSARGSPLDDLKANRRVGYITSDYPEVAEYTLCWIIACRFENVVTRQARPFRSGPTG
jgi:hypothetical protein